MADGEYFSGTTNSGSVPLPPNAATETTLQEVEEDLDVLIAKDFATETTLSQIKTDTDKFTFTANRLQVDGSGVTQPVSGTVAVSNFPATQPVSGTVAVSNFPATQNVAVTSSVEVEVKNDSGNPVPVSGTVSISGTVPVSGPLTDTQLRATAVPVSGTFFQATQPISGTVTANAGTNLNTSALALESGGNLAAIKTDVDKLTFTSTRLLVDGSGVTQPVSAASLPLPAGASTAALQTQPGVDIGDVTINNTSGAGAVNIQDGGNSITVDGSISVSNFPATQPVSGTVAATQSGTWTVQPGNTANTTAWKVDGSAVTQPVSGTFFQATQPVSGTVTANAGTGNFTVVQATAANLNATVTGTVAATQSGTWNITNVSGTVSLPTGASTAEKQPALGTAGSASADVITVQGIAGMTALKVDGSGVTQPVSGTVAATQSGTWTVQPGNTANTTAWLVKEAVATAAALTNVASSATNVTLLASNASRRRAMIFNDSTKNLYVKFGTTASTTSFTILMQNQSYYEVPEPVYTGQIDGIWSAANGAARVTEIT